MAYTGSAQGRQKRWDSPSSSSDGVRADPAMAMTRKAGQESNKSGSCLHCRYHCGSRLPQQRAQEVSRGVIPLLHNCSKKVAVVAPALSMTTNFTSSDK